MKIVLNEDKKLVAAIDAELKQNGGYCPCSIIQNEDTKCMCKEFREQTESGYCHCGKFRKI